MSTITLETLTLAPVRSARTPASPAVRPARGQVRLTRRGRVVLFVLALAVAMFAAIWLASGSAATRTEGPAPHLDVVTVAPGDTLWDLASDAAASSGGDVREMMRTIENLNAIDGGVLYVGQEIRVPAN